MRLDRLVIRNFRALRHVEIDLHPQMTVLIGANNVGKTSLIDALTAVLGFRSGATPFTGLDFRSADPNADIREAPPIQVDLRIAPSNGPKFAPGETDRIIPQVLRDGAERVFLRLEARFDDDASAPTIASTLITLAEDGTPLGSDPLGAFPFREQLPLRAFGPERDLRRGLGGRWSDWSTIIADARPEASVREKALTLLRQGSQHLIGNTPELAKIKDALADVGAAIGLGGTTVDLTAAPQDVEELLRNVSIELQLPGAGRGFHADRHGLGTQGALLFAIYRHQVSRMKGLSSVTPVLTIEEPEAHLHPTAQRSMAQQLARLPGQVVVASHSPELLTAANSRAVVLRSRKDGSVAYAARNETKHYVKEHTRALFARCILVVEGLESDAIDLCASSMNLDLAALGVEVINARGQQSIKGIWEVFGPPGYDAPIVCLADADDANAIDDFLDALVKASVMGTLPAQPDRYAVLESHRYFVAAPDRNVEEMLVAHDAAAVDLAFTRRGESTHADWRSGQAQQQLGKKLAARLLRLRAPGASSPSVVDDLGEDEARICRLSLAKGKGVIRDVFRVLTSDGTDRARLPKSYSDALTTVASLAEG